MNRLDDTAYLMIATAGLTVITILTRSAFFLLPARFRIPPTWERAMRQAPACALAAIVAPSILTRNHEPFLAWGNHQLWAVAVAVPIFVRTRSMVLLIGVGMAVFTVLRLA